MNFFGIESSSRNLSVGLLKDDCFSELHAEKINDTSNSLPQLSKKIINDASLSFEDLNAICISIGPGSFTGLRVGMSYAKGISIFQGLSEGLLQNYTLQFLFVNLKPIDHVLLFFFL